MKNLSLLPFVVMVLFSCNKKPQEASTTSIKAPEIVVEEEPEGLKQMRTYCYSCHNPKGSLDSRAAPPMIAIKKHYIKEGTSLEDFKAAMWDFVNNPTDEKAIMRGAVDKFGVMPKMNFTQEQINDIATYMYDNDIEKPEWFDDHYNKNHGTNGNNNAKKNLSKKEQYLQTGKKLALQTKGVLGKNLMNAIQTKGTEHALAFCSTRAIPLTDSMAIALKASIKRVSDKNRNPDNMANAEELNYIQQTKKLLAEGKDIQPLLQKIGGKHVGYYPITTNQMCLQCHGTPNQQIKPGTLAKIKSNYPNDLATGYKENELRGIWVIEMD